MQTTSLQAQAPRRYAATLLAGLVGNILEWFDFAVYGFFAPILAQLFFPSQNPTTSLIASFGAFAAGFLMRPIGGAVFGYIGDQIGRKRALNLSVLLMALPTFLIGLMPTYAQIGVLAPVLLVLLRMLQGLSVGGEFTSSIVYLAESAPEGKRGLFSSASLMGSSSGILLGSLTASFISNELDDAQMMRWGWRIPFILGIAVAGVGYLVRRHMPETHSGEAPAENPLRTMRRHWRAVLTVSGLNVLSAVAFYTVFVYIVSWLVDFVHEPRTMALRLNAYSMLVLLAGCPFSAWLSDRIGRKPVLITAAAGMLVLAYPLIRLMHHPSAEMIFFGQIGLAALVSLYAGTIPVTITEMFGRNIRVSAVSVGYNLTYALFGGTAPMVAVWLIQKEHNDMAFVWYIMATAAVSLVVLLRTRESAHEGLPE